MNEISFNNTSLQNQILEIYNKYPSIFSYERISVCSRLYYPIALVDVLVEENVRQPFSPIEQIVIELIKSGVSSLTDLTEAIGLPELYLKEILRELEAEELVEDFKLTIKGEYGHQQRIKFTTSIYKYSFQYDPILDEILINKEVDDKYLVPQNVTNSGLAHLLPHSHLKRDKLSTLFDTVSEEDMKVTSKRIKEVLSVKTYFVESVGLLFNLIPHPFIFFPDQEGKCKELFTISEANLNYFRENHIQYITVDRHRYYELWLYVKQMKDEMKKKQDNQIVVRDIKVKVRKHIQFCKEEHTVITDSGLSLLFDFSEPFELNLINFQAIQSLEWSSRHIPFLPLENEDDYSNFIAYSECYDRKVHDVSKLIFELEQSYEEKNYLFKRLVDSFTKISKQRITISELFELLTKIQAEKMNKYK